MADSVWLLFDAGCAACSDAANQIEAIAGDTVRTTSMLTTDSQRILDELRPGWRDEPHVLVVNEDGVHALSGLAMKVHLARRLGPTRGLRLARVAFKAHVRRSRGVDDQSGVSRRDVVSKAALALGAVPLLGAGVAGASAQSGASTKRAIKRLGTLRSDDPVLTALRQDTEIVAAASVFGPVLWDRVEHLLVMVEGHAYPVYTLILEGNSRFPGMARMFVTPVLSGPVVKVVWRIADYDPQAVRTELRQPTGEIIGWSERDADAQASDAAPVPPVDVNGWVAAVNRYVAYCRGGGPPPSPTAPAPNAPPTVLGPKTKCFLACLAAVTGALGPSCIAVCKRWVQYRTPQSLLDCANCTESVAELFILCCIICGLKPPDDDDFPKICYLHP